MKTRFFIITILTIVSLLLFLTMESSAKPLNRTQVSAYAADNELITKLDKVVESYRKIIILFDDETPANDPAQNQCKTAGHKIYAEKQQLLDDISLTLTSKIRKAMAAKSPQKLAEVNQFIDYVTNNKSLRDADRLAFLDLADELLSVAQETHAVGQKKSALIDTLQKLNEELKSIQTVYQEEVARIFSRFDTRGQQLKREQWQDYIKFLKSFLKREQILSEYASDSSDDQDSTMRGAPHDTKNELFGYDLPAKSIVLTFDDGPHPRYTEQILAILKQYNLRAFFFHIGKNLGTVDEKDNIKLLPTAAITKRIVEAGHIVANHSYSHPDLTKLSSEQRTVEIEKTSKLIEKVLGKKPLLFRPPFGSKNSAVTKDIEAEGMRSVLWNMDSLDWADPIPQSIVQRVLKELKENKKGIILFHDIHKQTIAALPQILDELIKEDYTFLIMDKEQLVPEVAVRAGEPNIAVNSTTNTTGSQDSVKSSFYRENWALVIGINDYKTWPKLRYCVNDANSIEEILINKFGFKKSNVIKLYNGEATREQIVKSLDQLADTSKISKDDRVFFFFAGHGATRKLPSGKEVGYIVPVDADEENYAAKCISMSQLQEFCELIPAKQLYFVIDSCYSGLALTRGGGTSPKVKNYLQEITKRVARQILTAGGADQQVADNGPGGHSIFTWTVLQGLQGLADTDGNGVITASELGAYVSPIVSSVSKQTPAFGNIVGSEGGEFIFELQNESLEEVSKQLDEEAIKLNDELEQLQQEIALKRSRNTQLKEDLLEEHAKLEGPGTKAATRGLPVKTEKQGGPTTHTSQAQVHQNMGLKFFREKKYDEAVIELQESAKLDGKNATISNNLGFVLFKLERYDEAIGWLNRAIQIDGHRAVAYVNLADAYLKSGKNAEAKLNYEKYLQLAPQSSRVEYVNQMLLELKSKE